MIPDSGPNALIVAGGSPDGLYESVLTSSSNDLYINFAGFNLALPNANSADLGSGSIRAIGGVSGLGGFSLALTNANLHSGGTQNSLRHSTDGLFSFWTTGNANGLAYTPSGGAIPDSPLRLPGFARHRHQLQFRQPLSFRRLRRLLHFDRRRWFLPV